MENFIFTKIEYELQFINTIIIKFVFTYIK